MTEPKLRNSCNFKKSSVTKIPSASNKASNLVVLSGDPGITFFSNSLSNTLVSWQANHGLVAFTDDKDIRQSGSKRVSRSVFDVHNVKRTWMTIPGGDDTNSPKISSAGDHA